MKTVGAENHYHWQVEVGHHHQDVGGMGVLWSTTGFGCLVHPRIVVTTHQVWKSAQGDWRRQDEVIVRIGAAEYTCQLGHEEEERNLAALVLARPVCDADGKPFDEFPNVTSELPTPGQMLGVMLDHHFYEGPHNDLTKYLCYTFGAVSLLRNEKQLFYALSGLEWQRTHLFGKAVFDPSGKLCGITTHYLKCNYESAGVSIEAQTGYLLFAPLTVKLRQAAEDSVKLLK